jgi:hypothetical protein
MTSAGRSLSRLRAFLTTEPASRPVSSEAQKEEFGHGVLSVRAEIPIGRTIVCLGDEHPPPSRTAATDQVQRFVN